MFCRKFKPWMKVISVLLIFGIFCMLGFDLLQLSRISAVAYAAEPQLEPDHQQPVELGYYSTASTEVYGNPDGTFTAEVSAVPEEAAWDTFIAAGSNEDHSGSAYLSVGCDSELGASRALLRWVLPDLSPFNVKIASARIGLYLCAPAAEAEIFLHRLTEACDPTTVDWDSGPGFAGEAETSLESLTEGYNYFDVTALVEAWTEGSKPNYGLLLKYDDSLEESAAGVLFYSADCSEPGERPKLILELIPDDQLGLADYWTYTPGILQGEGSALVNVLNGNLVCTLQLLDLESRLDAFNLSLIYNSRSPYWDAWGYGWNFSAQRRLVPNADCSVAEYINENGCRLYFASDGTGAYRAPPGTELTLARTDQGYTLEQMGGPVYYFDELGRNYKISDGDKDVVSYLFDGDSLRITEIRERYGEETSGREIRLAYNNSGLLEKITDLKGTETTFAYSVAEGVSRLQAITCAAGLPEAKSITFGYDENHRLVSLADANGNSGVILYDAANRVTEIVDPRTTPEKRISSIFTYNEAGSWTLFENARGFQTLDENNSASGPTAANVTRITEDYRGEHPLTTTYTWDNPVYASEDEAVAGQPIRYAAYVYDGETGLYYLQARYYDPEVGRFISQDPIWGVMEDPLSQNLYAYCAGDPVNNYDHSGMLATPANVVGALIGAVGGYYLGNAIANYIGLQGWARWAGTAGTSLLLGVVGWFSVPAIYAAVKAAIIWAISAGTLLINKVPDWIRSILGIVDSNKLNHVFGNTGHKLSGFLNSFGGNQCKAFYAVQNALDKLKLGNGVF